MQQIDLVLDKYDLDNLSAALAIKVHSFLLSNMDEMIAKSMQTSNDLRPFSLFTIIQQNNILLRISIFHDSASPFIKIARELREIQISEIDARIAVLERIEKPIITVSQLCKPAPKEFFIMIVSPASYMHRKKPSNLYSLPNLLYPVAEKLRIFEDIEISKEELSEACDLATYTSYNIHSVEYKLGPEIVRPAFEGEFQLRPGGSAELRNKLALLLRYATYTGVGAKTALGMGGIIIQE